MHILVTGGTGYIGSHTVVELLAAGHEVTLLDDLSNSDVSVLDRITSLTGHTPRLVVGDICDYTFVRGVFDTEHIDAVIHFAAKKAVEESMLMPEKYYQTNVGGLAVLCRVMRETGVRRCVFSSSAAAYGEPDQIPVTEDAALRPTSVYGATKKIGEELLQAMTNSLGWSVSVLRYFNPVGAHASGLIGENPRAANNLIPIVVQVVGGARPQLTINGNDYPTVDGTCVRDYIHVVDLARAHLAALDHTGEPGLHTYNIGTGRGHSILEVIASMKKVSGRDIPYTVGPRRVGDVSALVADTARASRELHWHAELTLDDMTRSAWEWWQKNQG